jgi:hypothetical protein
VTAGGRERARCAENGSKKIYGAEWCGSVRFAAERCGMMRLGALGGRLR